MGDIRFLLELFKRDDYPPELAIAVSGVVRSRNIFFFDTIKPVGYISSYWSTWGGNYNGLPKTTQVQVIMKRFLDQVTSLNDLLTANNAFYIDISTGRVYLSIDFQPWQYDSVETELEYLEGFSSAPKNPNNPSDDKYGGMRYPAILKIPSVVNKLPDSISGVALYLTWSASMDNSDGRFDDTEKNNFFNVPARLLKSNIDNPERTNFSIIRYGTVDDQKTNCDTFTLVSADLLRTLDAEVCDIFTTAEFPNLPDNLVDKKKPRVWGTKSGVKLSKINTADVTKFYAGDQISAVSAVYDTDGVSLSFTFDSASGVITETTAKAATATVTGSPSNRIGEIVRDVISGYGGIPFSASFWDLTETNNYITTSPRINYIYNGGSVKKLVTDVIKNDFAFLIQKNRGVLTLRKWGQEYTVHNIESWQITQFPQKDHTSGQKDFMTSVQVNYNKNESTGSYENSYLYDAQESAIGEAYRKRKLVPFYLDLAEAAAVESFAVLAIQKYGRIPENVSVGVSADTSEIELLDSVQLAMQINGREFSKKISWIVTETNPAQDKLGLEEA